MAPEERLRESPQYRDTLKVNSGAINQILKAPPPSRFTTRPVELRVCTLEDSIRIPSTWGGSPPPCPRAHRLWCGPPCVAPRRAIRWRKSCIVSFSLSLLRGKVRGVWTATSCPYVFDAFAINASIGKRKGYDQSVLSLHPRERY